MRISDWSSDVCSSDLLHDVASVLLLAPARSRRRPCARARGIVAVRSRRAPGLQVAVTHGGRTLPNARVPNRAAGDRLSLKLDLPEPQGARMLPGAAFLLASTNPPPKDLFYHSISEQPPRVKR